MDLITVVGALFVPVLLWYFTPESFRAWLRQWRTQSAIPGLAVAAPRNYAAFADKGRLLIEVPLVFINRSTQPIVIRNLRLCILDGDVNGPPLMFNATVAMLATDKERAFAKQIAVPPSATVELICEFQRRPAEMAFQARAYQLALEACLENETAWRRLVEFPLGVRAAYLPTLRIILRAYNSESVE